VWFGDHVLIIMIINSGVITINLEAKSMKKGQYVGAIIKGQETK